MNVILFNIRWWRWFLSSPSRFAYGLSAEGSRNWHIAQDRWMVREPKRRG